MLSLATFPFLNILLHPGPVPVLETQWLGYARSTEFRTALEQALALGRQHAVRGWLADDRLLGAVRPRDLAWVQQQVLAAIGQLGVRRFALVETTDALNRHHIGAMYAQAEPALGFALRRFTDIGVARAWAGGAA